MTVPDDWECEGQLGLYLRDEGMARATAAVMPWPDEARAWVRALPKGTVFTSEDLTDAIGLPRGEVGTNQNNAVGAIMRACSTANLIRKVGLRQSRKRQAHGATIIEWVRR